MGFKHYYDKIRVKPMDIDGILKLDVVSHSKYLSERESWRDIPKSKMRKDGV